ncbi:septation protein SepH [Actinomyces faecalis]|uniref:septation protein SepH n=1 Tax=Actinomyces faecalis TaxID=2722820 RepID=UPI001553EF67|nr:septation protein SepH [Actinomyces faecalis]
MIELELLGANGDQVVMTDQHGERYTIVVDDALRAAVRRARPAALAPAPQPPAPGSAVRPRDLQALMRAGASAAEVAQSTGLDVDHVRRFEGPVLAERAWAVEQARSCRIGWEKDSPVLGELVVDRLATRGVEPASLTWDALRQGREPWQVVLTFVQGAQEKQARWELDLTARSVTALDDEARWLTEAAALAQAQVFDQDSSAPGASARPVAPAEPMLSPPGPSTEDASTDALLADLASSRGRRADLAPPEADDEPDAVAPPTSPRGEAQVVSMSERRRAHTGNHPAGSRLGQAPRAEAVTGAVAAQEPDEAAEPLPEAEDVRPSDSSQAGATQEALPDMPGAGAPRPRRRSRRSVPSWDEIVFGAKPE